MTTIDLTVIQLPKDPKAIPVPLETVVNEGSSSYNVLISGAFISDLLLTSYM
ncbi:MAG TPA: hypothetical protein VE076_08600 [Nitrososphaeraceae archaeon]|nr:hypothetical protein [Nitrososphaeraceae archaeon]